MCVRNQVTSFQMTVPAVPVFISASGLCDVQYTISVACRDAFIYTFKKYVNTTVYECIYNNTHTYRTTHTYTCKPCAHDPWPMFLFLEETTHPSTSLLLGLSHVALFVLVRTLSLA